jgi:hypothetical protein
MLKDTITTEAGTEVGYMQIVPMTYEEKVRMYMRCTKLELAKMLAERDRLGIDTIPQPQIVPCPYPSPNIPWPYPSPNTAPWPNTPWYQTDYEITCNNSEQDSVSSTMA